jgi:FKBP-type peptidyl-prolyl cis-trans isomerase SlyD
MRIGSEKAVTISYTLKDDDGTVLDSSEGRAPLTYLHGAGNIVPGLEAELDGKEVGATVAAVVPPEAGYGPHDPNDVRTVPLSKLPGGTAEVGTRFRVQTDDGYLVAVVTSVTAGYATLDANHPLAGKTLHFDVKVLGIRDATDEELTHGHVHGEGGHHHHHHDDDDEGHAHGHGHGDDQGGDQGGDQGDDNDH